MTTATSSTGSSLSASSASSATPRARALWRYLGVAMDADPREVLGIRGAVLTEGRIEAAAQRRWRQVSEHPAAGEAAAHFARSAIVHAAETLLGRVPGRGIAHESQVRDAASGSELDRRLVDAIRSAGGMNRGAALRLARVGRAAGLEADEVLARLKALIDSGGFRARTRPGGGWRVARRLVRRGSGVPREIARLLEEVETVVDEATHPDAARRRESLVTVGLIVAMLATVLAISLWRVGGVGRPDEDVPAAVPEGMAGIDGGGASTGISESLDGFALEASEATTEAEQVDAAPSLERFVVSGPPLPGVPEWLETQRAAARLAAEDVPARLEDLARRIQGRNGTLDAAMLEGWRSIQAIPARCWFDESPDLLRRTLGASREVVAAVETWTAAESLVAALGELDPRRISPEGLRAGAWGAGLIGDLVRRPGLASAVRDQLQRRLDVLGLPPRTGWVAPDAFEETVARWLAAVVERLAENREDPERDEAWAVWCSIADRIEPVRLREALLVEGVRRLARAWETGDESTSRPRRLAALLEMLGPAVALDPDGIRGVLEETATPGGRHADPVAAWVLSSLIATRPGFEAWTPVSADADGASRARWLEEAIAAWPLPSSPLPRVDPERLQRVEGLVDIAAQRSRRDPATTISLLRAMGRLNAAISDWETSRARARVIFEEVELDLLGAGDLGVDPPRSAAEPASLDGRFAGAMRRSLENRGTRVDLVRELRRRAGGDLGPNDAAALARAAVKDAPEVRQAASAVLIERFGSGPEVLEAYLAVVDGMETEPLVVRTVERLAGVSLPKTTGPEAAIAVRRALADRLLDVRPSDARRLDLAAGGYAATLAARRGAVSEVVGGDPVAEAAALASRRLERLEGRPVLDELLDRRDRRRGVAEGPSQRLAGELVTLVEAEIEIARLERPDLSEALEGLAAEAVRRRQRSETSLEQVFEMELVLAELAILRAKGGPA